MAFGGRRAQVAVEQPLDIAPGGVALGGMHKRLDQIIAPELVQGEARELAERGVDIIDVAALPRASRQQCHADRSVGKR